MGFRSANTSQNSGTVTAPSGVANGDFLIAFVTVYDDVNTVLTQPSGWTLRGDQDSGTSGNHVTITVWTKDAGGSEPGSYTWSSNSGAYMDILCLAYSAMHASAFDVIQASSGEGVSTTYSATGITTTVANELLLVACSTYFGASNIISGMTQRAESESGAVRVMEETIASAGATGSRGTDLFAGTDDFVAFAVGLKPAGGVTPITLPLVSDFATDFTGWTETDTDGTLAASGGRAVFEYPPTTDAWGNPGLVSGAIARADLGALAAVVRLTNRVDTAKGFRVALSPSNSDSGAAGSGYLTLQYPDLFATAGDEAISNRRQRSKDHLWSVVKREGGGWILCVSERVAGGEWPVFPDAAIVSVTGTEADANVYAHLADRKARALVDYATVIEAASRPTALTTRLGAALASEASGTRASPGGGAAVASITNCGAVPRVIEAVLTRTGGGRAAICFRGSSSSYANCWKFKGEGDRVSLHDTSGVVTQTGAISMAADTPTHLKVVDFGTRIDCYVNGARWLDWTSSTGGTNTWAGTAADAGTSDPVTVTDFGAWKNVTLNDSFAVFPEPPIGKGSALFTAAFTGTNGSALSGVSGWTASGAGTWEINTNKARMSAAGVNGMLLRSPGAAGATVQISAAITLPGSTAAYPLDWFAGVIVRWQDANNFIQARYLYQDDSPEVEVWEYVAGAGSLIGYVNLGAGNLAAGSTHTLALAARGAEVAAYHDGELVVQATTSITASGSVGIGVNDTNPSGQASWDDVSILSTQPPPIPVTPAGGLVLSGALSKQVRIALSGAFTDESITLPVTLTGNLAPQAALSKRVSRSFAGTFHPTGSLTNAINPGLAALGGTLTTAGTIRRRVGKALVATATTAGALKQQARRALTGILAPTGTFTRTIARTRSFTGTLTTAGTLALTKIKLLSFSGTLTTSGAIAVRPTRQVTPGGVLSMTGGYSHVAFRAPIPEPVEAQLHSEITPPEFLLR